MPLSSRGILQCLYENLEVNAFENAKRVASKLSATPHTHTEDSIVCCVERWPSGKSAWNPEEAKLPREDLTVYRMPVGRQQAFAFKFPLHRSVGALYRVLGMKNHFEASHSTVLYV